MDHDENTLLARLAADLDRTFEELLVSYWPSLYAFALRRIGSLQDAEDIVSEVFVRAYIALKGYPVERIHALQLRPWLYKIAYHEYCRFAGKNTLSLVPLVQVEERTIFAPGEGQSQQPEAFFEEMEQRQELESLVAALPEHYREVVSLFYFDELSYQEIAELLDQPLGTVKSSIHRGIHLLRKQTSARPREVH